MTKLPFLGRLSQANKVYFYATGQAWASNQVPLKGVRVYFPSHDTAYNLRVVNLDNTVESYKNRGYC